MNEILKQISWNMSVIAAEIKRYNDAQGYPPSDLTQNIQKKRAKAVNKTEPPEVDPSTIKSDRIRKLIFPDG